VLFVLGPIALFKENLLRTFDRTVNKHVKYVLSNNITMNDVTITVKTTERFHRTRVDLLLNTWIKRVLNQVCRCNSC